MPRRPRARAFVPLRRAQKKRAQVFDHLGTEGTARSGEGLAQSPSSGALPMRLVDVQDGADLPAIKTHARDSSDRNTAADDGRAHFFGGSRSSAR
jgi:hypothetical protein